MKKTLALLLAIVMVMSLVACGQKTSDPTTEATGANTEATEASKEPAASTEATEKGLDPVTLRIWFHGSTVTPDASKKVMDELNKYLGEKINVTLEPIWGTWGDFDTASTTSLAAGGDGVDIYFTCNWSGDEYNKYARDGYWYKLDDLLDQYAPELKTTIPEDIWNAARINGYDGEGIYAVPALKDTATQNCWDVNATLLAELGYDPDEVCSKRLDYFSPEFEEMLQKAKDAKGADFYPLLIEPAVLERLVCHSAIVTGDLGNANILSYYYDADHPAKDIGSTLVNKFGTDEFAKFAAKTYEYAQKGFISPSCQSTATANDYRTATRANAEYLIGTQSYAYGCEVEYSAARGIDVRMVPETAPYMDCTSGQGAMMAVSVASKNPERAVMFLNLLNTDPKVMTMLNYGVEGFTYTDNGDGTISFIKEGRDAYNPWRNGMGNIRILPPTANEGADYWDRFAAYYDSAEMLPYSNFIFDSTPVKQEGAALANVYAQYAFNLMSGAVNPDEVLPEFLSKMEEAGSEKFVTEAQNQLAEFLK